MGGIPIPQIAFDDHKEGYEGSLNGSVEMGLKDFRNAYDINELEMDSPICYGYYGVDDCIDDYVDDCVDDCVDDYVGEYVGDEDLDSLGLEFEADYSDGE